MSLFAKLINILNANPIKILAGLFHRYWQANTKINTEAQGI